MKRFLFLLPLALPACTSNGGTVASTGAAVVDSSGIKPPTPLAGPECKAGVTATAKTVDALALSLSALSHTSAMPAGSPRSLTAARALDVVRHGVNAASHACDAGNSASYHQALDSVQAAIAEITTAIGA